MSNSAPHDGTVWNTDVPTDGEPHGNDYKEHQATKKAIEFVNNKEHEDIGADPSASDGGGVHSLGSSVAYFGTSTPTKRPDGDTNLAANDIDRGRVWFDSNFSPPVMKKWSGSAWVQAGNKVLNDTYYTGVNEADDGTVNLIKAGRNEADNADVAIISDAARTATDAAPGEDTGLVNKKYVNDQIAALAFSAYTNKDSDNNDMLHAHAYLAVTDGFVSAVDTDMDDNESIKGYVDTDTNPVSGGLLMGGQQGGGTDDTRGIFFAVASGEYFEIRSTSTNPAATLNIFWKSVGTLSKPVDQD